MGNGNFFESLKQKARALYNNFFYEGEEAPAPRMEETYPQALIAFQVIGILAVGQPRLSKALNFHGPGHPAILHIHADSFHMPYAMASSGVTVLFSLSQSIAAAEGTSDKLLT